MARTGMLTMAMVASALLLAMPAAYADEAIQTQVLLKTTTTNIGQRIVYPHHGRPEITTMIVTIPPGGSTVRHVHPAPVIGYILSGELEVRAAGGKVNRYKAGDSFVEALDHEHAGTNIGSVPTRILVMVVGIEGKPYAVPVRK